MHIKMLIDNNGTKLFYDPTSVNRFKVLKDVRVSSSVGFAQMLCQSPIFSPKVKSYFTRMQIVTALAKIHAMRYANKKFKA